MHNSYGESLALPGATAAGAAGPRSWRCTKLHPGSAGLQCCRHSSEGRTTTRHQHRRIHQDIEKYFCSLTLFVKPESDFEGVSLYVWTSDGTRHTAWFPAEESCFPRDDTWLEFKAVIWRTGADLSFYFRSLACLKECEINAVQAVPMNFGVVAHGPSKWLTQAPSEICGYQILGKSDFNETANCMQSPSTTTNTTINGMHSTLKIIIAASAAAAAVVVVVVVVVVVICWKRKATISPRPGGLFRPPDEHVIENEIYEPFDSPANDAGPQTFQNELYESFSPATHSRTLTGQT
ncbi:uncharacterized protein LOC135101225 [Scylla paramamosain]|uniref:uncharacterized protein LOC135101225 n=1 Tax=Scylla paramamosain TaxID=85552 RepID=UPI003082AA3E